VIFNKGLTIIMNIIRLADTRGSRGMLMGVTVMILFYLSSLLQSRVKIQSSISDI
jgi:hypothetical protein